MYTLVQWATILSPIIAVLIAIWASRSSAKDTAKKLVALEESTKIQVESVKELTKIQIEITKLQLQKELWEANLRYSQTAQRVADVKNRQFSNIIPEMEAYHIREDKKKDMTDNCDFWKNQVALLNELMRQVDELSKNVNEE